MALESSLGMPVPPFDLSGVIPPFIGPQGPGGARQDLSPYVATPLEVVIALGTTADRRDILQKWLAHRQALRALGFLSGFQWLDGSFVEDKQPQDLDVVTFLHRPARAQTAQQLAILVQHNPTIFNRAAVKTTYHLDLFFIDMDGTVETVIDATRYFCGLFSHRRVDFLWKGMLRVELGNATDDAMAAAHLALMAALPPPQPRAAQ